MVVASAAVQRNPRSHPIELRPGALEIGLRCLHVLGGGHAVLEQLALPRQAFFGEGMVNLRLVRFSDGLREIGRADRCEALA